MVGLGLFVEAGPIRGEGCEKWRLESFPVDILAKVNIEKERKKITNKKILKKSRE